MHISPKSPDDHDIMFSRHFYETSSAIVAAPRGLLAIVISVATASDREPPTAEDVWIDEDCRVVALHVAYCPDRTYSITPLLLHPPRCDYEVFTADADGELVDNAGGAYVSIENARWHVLQRAVARWEAKHGARTA
jgi:hypothetical protein